MRKIYSKPEIIFESFSMSTNIAGDCSEPYVKNPSKGSCGIATSSGQRIFVDKSTGCDYPDDDGLYNNLCYDVPMGYEGLFNS